MTTSAPGVVAGVDEGDKVTSVALLREMMRIRELEQRSLDLSTATPPEVIGSAHLCAGQEAVPVGALAGLAEADQIIATYRGHGWALASGLSLTEVFGEICQRSIGVNGGRGGSAKARSFLMAVAACVILWVAVSFHLISFGTNY